MPYRKVDWVTTEGQLIKLVQSGLSFNQACTVAGIDKSSIYRRYKKKFGSIKPLQEKIEDAKKFYEAWIKSEMQQLYEKLKQSDYVEALKHLRWLAERKLRDEFYRKQQVINVNSDTTSRDKKSIKSLYNELKEKYGKDVGEGKNSEVEGTPAIVSEG